MGWSLDAAAFGADAVIELKDVEGEEVPAEDGSDAAASADVGAVAGDDAAVAAAGAGVAHVGSVLADDVADAVVVLQHDADVANAVAADVVRQELGWLAAPRLKGQEEPFLCCSY